MTQTEKRDLAQRHCEICRVGSPQASQKEIDNLLPKIPEWTIITVDGMNQLTRSYDFKDFVTAIAFTNKVGAIAEEEDHHPTILTQWGSVKLTWWTHTIKGLHANDFVMAAKSDALFIV